VTRCASLPEAMPADLNAIFQIAAPEVSPLPGHISRLLDHLDQWLVKEGFDLNTIT
jgi:hypothetical protein